MKREDFSSHGEPIALEGIIGEPFNELDSDTRATIETAEAEADAGMRIPVDQAFVELRKKHFHP